jgi:hypothetical protein
MSLDLLDTFVTRTGSPELILLTIFNVITTLMIANTTRKKLIKGDPKHMGLLKSMSLITRTTINGEYALKNRKKYAQNLSLSEVLFMNYRIKL